MKRKFLGCVLASMLSVLGITGCSYISQESTTVEMPLKETTQAGDDVDPTQMAIDMITDNPTTDISPKDDNTIDLSGEVSESNYKMELYTEAQNEDSSIKIQYPVFSGNKAEEINLIITKKVQDLARLDSSLFPENTKMMIDYQSAVTLHNSKMISIVIWGTSSICLLYTSDAADEL